MTKQVHYAEVNYGFEYGAARVVRQWSHKGTVSLLIATPRQSLEIHVTPSGLIRVKDVTPGPRVIPE